ncbi:MAG: MarR family transcriptional regulator [Acidiferrobacterales bacterium]|jgi:MarR family transcriptional regulator for hemolysin|nr:MarR family transcriptional regulator [Acidiferrobacterales bacterium]
MNDASQTDSSAVLKTEAELFPVMLVETSRAWRALMDQRLAHLGLSQAKWLALLHIHRGGADMTQKELASRLGVEGPTITALLDRLMRDDYIERRESPTDRRAKTVHLTPKAKQLMKKIIAVAAQLRGELFENVPLKDLQACIRTFQRIQQTADNLARQQQGIK